MNIEFFGPSIIASGKNNQNFYTFYDLLLSSFNASSLNTQIPLCSEERILYNLKKTTNIDVALIFHTQPQFIYFPNFTRDHVFYNEKEIHNQLKLSSLDFIEEFKQNKKDHVNPWTLKSQQIESNRSLDFLTDFMDLYFNRDVNLNRFHGALNLINDYLFNRKIPVIHFVSNKSYIPSWFKFKSGIIDETIFLSYSYGDNMKPIGIKDKDGPLSLAGKYQVSYSKSSNAISEEGNTIFYNMIKKYINELLNNKEYYLKNSKTFNEYPNENICS